jgi:hypothetical protein
MVEDDLVDAREREPRPLLPRVMRKRRMMNKC